MRTYLVVYLGTTFLALVITPVVIWLAHRIGAVDLPDARRVHSGPIPRIGGFSLLLPTLCIVLPVLFHANAIGEAFRLARSHILVLLGAATFIFAVGLYDDLRGLRARTKLAAQLLAAAAVCTFGARITSLNIADSLSLRLGLLSWPITLLWIAGITNAVNLIDGLDGLAAGISAVACGTIAVLAVYGHDPVMAVLMLALLGSLSGFLFYNFNPARIFMGDGGSLFVGFTIAASSVLCANKSHTLVGLGLPFLALGIPIFDTMFSMLRRFLERRSIFSPDRSHFHHKLLDLGLRQRHVVLIAYLVTVACVGFGMFMMVARDVMGVLIFACIVLLLLLVFRAVGTVRLRATLAGLKQKYTATREVKQELRAFEEVQLRVRRARTTEEFWRSMCEAASGMNFLWLSLAYEDHEGCEQTVVWRASGPPPHVHDAIITQIPFRRSGNGNGNGRPPVRLEVAIAATDSLESVGRRTSLFGRLLDESPPIQLDAESITRLTGVAGPLLAHDVSPAP